MTACGPTLAVSINYEYILTRWRRRSKLTGMQQAPFSWPEVEPRPSDGRRHHCPSGAVPRRRCGTSATSTAATRRSAGATSRRPTSGAGWRTGATRRWSRGGTDTRTFREVREPGRELASAPRIAGTRSTAEVALVRDGNLLVSFFSGTVDDCARVHPGGCPAGRRPSYPKAPRHWPSSAPGTLRGGPPSRGAPSAPDPPGTSRPVSHRRRCGP